MKSNSEKIENAWRDYYTVSHSEGMYCGNMICYKCNKKIRGYYLIQERSNFMLRGNEHDKTYLFHRKCSSDNVKWSEHSSWIRQQNISLKIRKNQISEVKALIKKYGLDANDLFEFDSQY